MSRFGPDKEPNPLAAFKSYSYYFSFVICDSTETAETLASATTDVEDLWKHPRVYEGGNHQDLGIYNPKTITINRDQTVQQAPNEAAAQGKYCVLIHGATDAAFTITSFRMNTVTAAVAVNNDRGGSIAIEGSMEISEPRGVKFLDTFVKCCIALGRDPGNIACLVKPFFVGYNDKDELETISNVPPFMFTIYSSAGTFTEAGGQYKLEMVGSFNGQSRQPQYSKMVVTPNIPNAKTLGEAISMMFAGEDGVNAKYEEFYSCVKKQFVAGTELDDRKHVKLQKVKYECDINPYYLDSSFLLCDNMQAQATETGECGEPKCTYNSGQDTDIESALHMMINACSRVAKDADEGIKNEVIINRGTCGERKLPIGTKVKPRISSSVHTLTHDLGSEDQYTTIVKYKIDPAPIPRSLVLDYNPENKQLIDDSLIEFDYIYTGKSIDILEFDIRVNNGMAFMMIATQTNSYKDQAETVPAKEIHMNPKETVIHANRNKDGTNKDQIVDVPVFFGTVVDLPAKRTMNEPASTVSYIRSLSQYASFEVLDSTMKITGNLQLLGSVNAAATPSQIPLDCTTWSHIPTYAKINVRMPRLNDDIALLSDLEQDYTEEFWFDGFYFVYGIEHVFEDGEFSQNLNMVGVPKPDLLTTEMRQKNTTTFVQNVEDCVLSKGKCAPGSSAPSQQAPSKSSEKAVTGSPAAQHAATQPVPVMPPNDMDKIISTTSPSNIKNWDKMSPDVQNAIANETQGDKIPLSTYAAIASIESAGKSTATSSTGAAGIFQFTRGTWNSVMPEYKVSSTTPATSDPRYDPTLNARASRKYLNQISNTLGGTTDPTWLYMGHNLGPGAAKAVMNHQSPNCKPMSQLYAENPKWKLNWSTFAAQNGYSQNATTCTIRDEIAGKYKKQIIDANASPQAPGSQPMQVGQQAARPPASTPSPKPNKEPKANETSSQAAGKCDQNEPQENKAKVCGTKPVQTNQTLADVAEKNRAEHMKKSSEEYNKAIEQASLSGLRDGLTGKK